MAVSGDLLALGVVGALAAAGAVRRGSASDGDLGDAFWRWFGDSKVVDRRGRPLVVYHGTGEDEPFEVFDESLIGEASGGRIRGFYFAGKVATANAYRPDDYTVKPEHRQQWAQLHELERDLGNELLAAWNAHYGTSYSADSEDPDTSFLKDGAGEYVFRPPRHIDQLQRRLTQVKRAIWAAYDDQERMTPRFWNRKKGGQLIAAYLSLQEPYEVDASGAAWSRDFESGVKAILRELGESLDDYDGLIVRNFYDGEVGVRDDVFVAFRPEQIKRIDNRGTWDPRDPRMSYNRRMT